MNKVSFHMNIEIREAAKQEKNKAQTSSSFLLICVCVVCIYLQEVCVIGVGNVFFHLCSLTSKVESFNT